MIYDVELILEAQRRDAELGEELLEAFLAVAPASDPVIDQDTETGRTTVAFEVEAADMNAAAAKAIEVVQAAFDRFGTETTDGRPPPRRRRPRAAGRVSSKRPSSARTPAALTEDPARRRRQRGTSSATTRTTASSASRSAAPATWSATTASSR